MADRDRDTRDTTVIHTDTGRSSGGGGWFIAGLLVAVLLLGFFAINSGMFSSGGGETLDVNVELPEVEAPAAE
ncbi:hypothetical protein FHS72_000120 [Loktanella ponticola]|uniref:Uncharacterized protein n=1 Tax=Yoonia ponticola TaxID=1524255 RepID=A0A7W9BHG1_9RHOB|nr:hypothetical protein [Yoonia ponticola]MBB5720516.1 hypothetical protein [Yoonia ponticola]